MGFSQGSSRLLIMVAVIGILTTAGESHAQTIAISMAGIARKVPLRSDQVSRFKVSRSDCFADDVISFPLVVSNYAGSTLEVWATQASDDCTTATARTTATATCWQLWSGTPNSTTVSVSIPVRAFAARPPASGTPDSCVGATATGQPVTLYFMFMQGTSHVGTSQKWSTTVDLLGPAPPVFATELGVGHEMLVAEWKQNTDPDVVGYRIFCEAIGVAPPPVTSDAGSSGAGGTNGNTCPDGGTDTADAGDDANAGSPDGSCTPGAAGAGGSSGAGGSGGGESACGAVNLLPDTLLTPSQESSFLCGSVQGTRSTNSKIFGLQDFQMYGVAIASVDLVQNVGPLSTVLCKFPEPVNGFDEVYRTAGGTAGGASFCSLSLRSHAARLAAWPALALPIGAALWRWRRRQRQFVNLR